MAFFSFFCLKAQEVEKSWLVKEAESGEILVDTQQLVDETTLKKAKQQLIKRQVAADYLSAYFVEKIDSFESLYVFYLHQGPQYQWALLEQGNLMEHDFIRAYFKNKSHYFGTTLAIADFQQLFEEVITHAENNGYPFASIRLTNIKEVEKGMLKAAVDFTPGSVIKIDSLVIEGTAELKSAFLEAYTGLKKGDLYEEKKIKALSGKFNQLVFIEQYKSPEVVMEFGKATVYLYLNERNANIFNGMVGIAPNSNETDQFLLTGNAELQLKNPFYHGSEGFLKWEKMQVNTQEISTQYFFPYPFALPLALETKLNLLRQDTTFVDLNTNLGFLYLIERFKYIKFYWDYQRSFALSEQPEQSNLIQNIGNFTNQLYGIEVKWMDLDYFFNPQSGWHLTVDVGAGTSITDESAEDEEAGDANIVGKMTLDLQKYVKIGQKSTLMFHTQWGHWEDENLYFNQLFRLGGMQDLKGFDDRSLFAGGYATAELGYRYITEEKGYLTFFANFARLWNSPSVAEGDLYAVGTGYQFQSGNGVFSIFYALGNNTSQDFDFRGGRIHFGYVNYF